MPTMMQQLTNELDATNGGTILSVIPGSPNRHLLDKAMKLVATDVDLKGNCPQLLPRKGRFRINQQVHLQLQWIHLQ